MRLIELSFNCEYDEIVLPPRLASAFGDIIPAPGSFVAIPFHGRTIDLEVLRHNYRVESYDQRHTTTLLIDVKLGAPRSVSITAWLTALRNMKESPHAP